MDEEVGKPKPAFYLLVAMIVLGLLGFALYRADILFPKAAQNNTPQFSQDEMDKLKTKAEAPDSSAPTTVKEYKYVAAEKLPPITGAAAYKPLENNTVRFALNVWAGWAPIFFANEGSKPNKTWTTSDGKQFKIELVLIDNPVAMRDAFASGSIHIGWATVDMLPLFIEELKKDSRTMPRVFQQIDWSNGGDGIVVREHIKSISQLRGKNVALAVNSPSEYFMLNLLINAGVQPSEVTFKPTDDAFQAAAAFNNEKSVDACVSWAPDIYNLGKVKGNKTLVTTAEASRLIADVWFSRADFAKENPGIIEAICRGIFDAVEDLDKQENKQKVAKWMSEKYQIPEADALGMLGDAHWTNYAENREFFLNANNPTNFEQTYRNACFLYARMNRISRETVTFDQIADFSIIQKLGNEEKYKNSVNKYKKEFVAKSVASIKAESGEILTKTVVVHFFPNSSDLRHKKPDGEAYDPNVDNVLKEIAKLATQFGASRIVIEGHTDGSMKGNVPFEAVKALSAQRADAMKRELLKIYQKEIPANQVSTEGMGWQRAADPSDPDNHAKNRRVEVKVYPLEAQ